MYQKGSNIGLKEAKINLSDVCFFDLVPENFLLELCEIKNQITESVFKRFERPKNYDFMLRLMKFSADLKTKKLVVETKMLDDYMSKQKTRSFKKKIVKTKAFVDYDIFGTITGRLKVKKDSFPILTLDKDHRGILKPNNDAFIELDFNAAEFRTFLALLGIPQPKGDIHCWTMQNVFKGALTREEVKKKTFAWLYNPDAKNAELDKRFNKKKAFKKYLSGDTIITPFGRKIKTDGRHALNYLIQSTTSDIFLRRMLDLNDLLKEKGCESYIAFSVHDSLILDFKKEEKKILSDLIKCFSETEYGKFKVNVSLGKNYKDMCTLQI